MRLPPGARWDDVESRVTQDSATGEIIEDRHSRTNPARAHAALQRLDKVRDIETVVTLFDRSEDVELIDLTVDSGIEDIGLLEPGQRWADCDSE